MKRPELPTGDQSETVRLLRVATHPTQVIRRVARRVEAAESTPRFLLLMEKLAVVTVTAGTAAVVGAFLIRQVPEVSVPALIVGMLLVSAGMSMASLENLLDPERPELDQRLVSAIRKLVRR